MAKEMNIQKNLIDAVIAVGGAGLLQTQVVERVPAIANALSNLPVVGGISTSMIVLAGIALVAVKTWIMK